MRRAFPSLVSSPHVVTVARGSCWGGNQAEDGTASHCGPSSWAHLAVKLALVLSPGQISSLRLGTRWRHMRGPHGRSAKYKRSEMMPHPPLASVPVPQYNLEDSHFQ